MRTLLKTKLYLPQYSGKFVARQRLADTLNQGLDGKLILISAPAGFGKTTLLSEWIHQCEIPFGWISLDENDNDPGRFLTYLAASLGSIGILVEPEPAQMFQSFGQGQIEAIINGIINQMADAQRQYGVVLDDYHHIQNKEIHGAISYLLAHLPPQVFIVIATRADPPLPIARLRARGQLTEIRSADLRFNTPEGHQFLNELYNLVLGSDDVQKLVSRTDGWIAGLQLASIALQGRPDAAEYIQRFSGNQDYIADFLTTEVLEQQPEHLQAFLLRTSILNRLTAPLCEALTGQAEPQKILNRLRSQNIFLQALDDEHQWYAYHLLFRDLLSQQLMATYPEEIPDLYLIASNWCEEHGLLNDAIDYAFQGDLFQRAASLVEEQAEATLLQSEIGTFLGWMRKLPDEVIFEKESLCIYFAWANLVSLEKPTTAEIYLDQVTTSKLPVLGRLNAVQAILAVNRKEIPRAIDLARQALANLPEDDFFFRQIAAWNLSAALFISGDQEGGVEMLKEVARFSLASKNLLVAVVALCRLGSYQFQRGDLQRAKGLFRQALEIASTDKKHPLPVACEAMLGLGKVHWEWYQLDTAKGYLSDGIELSKKWRETTGMDGYIHLAHVYQSLGDQSQADQMIETACKIAFQKTATETDDRFVASQAAHIYLRQGDIQGAAAWSKKSGLERYLQEDTLESDPKMGTDIVLRYELLVYARTLIAHNQFKSALRLLKALKPSIEKLGHHQKILETHLLMALGWQGLGVTDRAMNAMKNALELAISGGYLRVFVDEGFEITNLLKKLKTRGDHPVFVQKILDTYPSRKPKSRQSDGIISYIEPLSEREIEILNWLVSDLSGPEIAQQIHIAVSTLRTHVRNIYRKLDTHSRFETVSKARNLKII